VRNRYPALGNGLHRYLINKTTVSMFNRLNTARGSWWYIEQLSCILMLQISANLLINSIDIILRSVGKGRYSSKHQMEVSGQF
jgi:hypothetical protein